MIAVCMLAISPVVSAQAEPPVRVQEKMEYNLLEARFVELIQPVFLKMMEQKGREVPENILEREAQKMVKSFREGKKGANLNLTDEESKQLKSGKSIVKDMAATNAFWSKAAGEKHPFVLSLHPLSKVKNRSVVDNALLERMAIVTQDYLVRTAVMHEIVKAKNVYTKVMRLKIDGKKLETIADLKLEDREKFLDPETKQTMDWVYKGGELRDNSNKLCLISPKPIHGKYIIAFWSGSTVAISEKEALEKYLKKK